jgi:hypothetical protein
MDEISKQRQLNEKKQHRSERDLRLYKVRQILKFLLKVSFNEKDQDLKKYFLSSL